MTIRLSTRSLTNHVVFIDVDGQLLRGGGHQITDQAWSAKSQCIHILSADPPDLQTRVPFQVQVSAPLQYVPFIQKENETPSGLHTGVALLLSAGQALGFNPAGIRMNPLRRRTWPLSDIATLCVPSLSSEVVQRGTIVADIQREGG